MSVGICCRCSCLVLLRRFIGTCVFEFGSLEDVALWFEEVFHMSFGRDGSCCWRGGWDLLDQDCFLGF